MPSKFDFRSYIILAILFVFLANAVVVGWLVYISSRSPQITLSEPLVLSTTALCPGETLDYQFVISANKSAAIDLTTSIRPQSPQVPARMVRLEQLTFDGSATLTLVRHYVIPPYFSDPLQGDVPWKPGAYLRRTTARVDGSSQISDEFEIEFSIRSDCP